MAKTKTTKTGKAAKAAKRTPAAKAPKARKVAKPAAKVPALKAAAKPKATKPAPLKDALAPLAGPAGKAVWQPVLTATESPRRYLSDIKVANRFRQHKGDIAALAASIDARGALLEPIVIAPDGTLIDGERRMLAWEQSRVGGYGKEPIPVSIVDIDSIIAGEYDANEQREPFRPTELVAIKRAIEEKLKAGARARQGHGLTAPGKKKSGEVEGRGRTADKVGAAAGVSGRTIEKAEKVVEAAERDPERFGKLAADMDRTGKVDGAHKRLKIMQATDAMREAPPPLPGNGPYVAGSIDFPWPHESDDDQASIDERGRSLRPYPAMSIEAGEVFMREQVAPLFGPNAALGFWVTNHHLVNGAAHRLIAALGADWRASTMLTWAKDKIGRGQVLRDKTEHCIVLLRGKPVVNVLGEDPPSTLLFGPRRDNSQKPEDFYLLWERTFPAPRYASIFSTGGEGELWDGHGDQVDKHAAAPVDPAEAAKTRTELDRLAMVNMGEAARLTIDERDDLREHKLIKGAGERATLTIKGSRRLETLRVEAVHAAALAELPDDLDGLAVAYRELCAQLDAAVRGGAKETAKELDDRRELFHDKAGMLIEDPAEAPVNGIDRLHVAAAAPIGNVPFWGQRGMFRIEVDGIPAIVDFGGWLDGLSFHAVDPAKPFISDTGYHHGFSASVYAICRGVAEHVEALFRDELATVPDTKGGAKRKPRKGPPPLPETVYRLPASWQEIAPGTRECAPIEIPPIRAAAPAEAPPAVRKKRGRKTVQDDIDDFTASADRDGAQLDDLARDQAETVERLCDLAPSEGEALHDRAVAAGHTIRMTRANLTNEHVATCACGAFDFRIAGGPDPDGARHAVMDAAIVDHWSAALGQAAPEPPTALPASDDFPDMPEGLRRHRDPPPADNDEATHDAGEGRHDDAA